MSEQQMLLEFVRWLLTAAGAGAAVFQTVEEIQRLWPNGRKPLSGDQKFYLAWVLSFVYPALAYGLMLVLLNLPFTWEGVFAAFAAGYAASQKLHRDLERREEVASAKWKVESEPSAEC